MDSKRITLSREAYDALTTRMLPGEDLSRALLRLTGVRARKNKRPLSDFFGVLSKESADELERHIRESRNPCICRIKG